jgi:hypothetical protein
MEPIPVSTIQELIGQIQEDRKEFVQMLNKHQHLINEVRDSLNLSIQAANKYQFLINEANGALKVLQNLLADDEPCGDAPNG